MTMMQNQAPAAAGTTFVPQDLFPQLGSLQRAQADAYDFGIVQVDDQGKILLYNRGESMLTGVAPTTAEGKSFFTQVAPCTNNSLFFGNFKKGIAAGNLNVTFNYTFTFKMKPTNVRIHLYRCPSSNTNWIFVQRA